MQHCCQGQRVSQTREIFWRWKEKKTQNYQQIENTTGTTRYIHYDRRFSRGVEPGSLARTAISETTRPPEQRPLMQRIFMKLYWSYNYRCRGSGGPGACSSKNPETFRARKAIAKSGTLRSITKLFFIHLFLYEQRFPSNKNSSTYISPFLDTDELKKAFEKRTLGACFSKDWKVFRPAKPFTNRESWICLKLLVGREPIFILRIRESNGSIIRRLLILLRLRGVKTFQDLQTCFQCRWSSGDMLSVSMTNFGAGVEHLPMLR